MPSVSFLRFISICASLTQMNSNSDPIEGRTFLNKTNTNVDFQVVGADLFIACGLSTFFIVLSLIIGIFLMTVIIRTKARLHTCRHLLMWNSSFALTFYCIVQLNNYIFLLFLPWQSSDISCRWRGYFTYMSIVAVSYSYFIQTISRFFFAVLTTKYPILITFRSHYLLLGFNWLGVILIPLPAIITDDIRFVPNSLCWVPFSAMLHVLFTVVAHYLIPLSLVVIMYAYIYCRVKRHRQNIRMSMNTNISNRLELELLRNILVLIGIFFLGGTPTVLFMISLMKFFYLMAFVTLSFCAAFVQLCTILLDRDLRDVVRSLLLPRTRVVPITQLVLSKTPPPKVANIANSMD